MNTKIKRFLVIVLVLLVLLVPVLTGCGGGKCTVMCCKDVTVLGFATTQCNAFRSSDCSCPGNYYLEYVVRDNR